MTLIKEEKIHLSDLRFSQLCEELFRINRGVFNTIDYWFYSKGIINIIKRREVILDFLGSLDQGVCKNRKFIKFGSKGLSAHLDRYWETIALSDYN